MPHRQKSAPHAVLGCQLILERKYNKYNIWFKIKFLNPLLALHFLIIACTHLLLLTLLGRQTSCKSERAWCGHLPCWETWLQNQPPLLGTPEEGWCRSHWESLQSKEEPQSNVFYAVTYIHHLSWREKKKTAHPCTMLTCRDSSISQFHFRSGSILVKYPDSFTDSNKSLVFHCIPCA